ncbi:MAG: sigma-70 family RNA polymerase sigma factor [Nitrospirota bacterium]|nr:sigma-70 family RNA polymerase sigma factor [Nitrospirota bacterium]MDX2420419.1 sigma-70 family RNA polymerase sigma factor [Nitrospirota bacterium]
MAGLTREEILRQLRERILAFATSRGIREAAEDLTQDVLMVLHEKYPHVSELTELVPLSFQILRFKMLDRHRKTLRRGEYNQESVDKHPLVDPGDDPAMQAEQKERVTQLIAALQQLGERCQELFRLKLEGNTFPEIQQILGERSINTIYTWDLRCRKQLLTLMGGQWESISPDGKGQKHNKESVG